MTRLRIALGLALVLAGLVVAARVDAAPPCGITWDGPAAGSWHVAANWDLDRVPAADDVVCIPAGVMVTHSSGPTTIQTLLAEGTLQVSGGTLALTGAGANESVAQTLELTGGDLGGTGTLVVAGTLTWMGGSMVDAGTTRVAAGATLVREQQNTVFLEDGRELENQGTIDLRTDRFISPSGAPAPLIDNQGTIVKSAGAGTATIAAAVENDGVVRSDSGVLELRGGDGGGTSDGDYGEAGATGTVRFGAGAFELADGARLLGGASVEGASVDVADGATATASGANTLASGAIGGTGTLDVTGTLTWTGGSMVEAGKTRVTASGTLVRDQQNTVFLETGRELENLGTIDLRTDRFISPSGIPAPLIHNEGSVVKSAGAGTATIATALENDGAVRSDAGVLELRGGDGDGSSAGDFGGAAAPGTLRLGAGTFELADDARLLGSASVEGATVDVADGATATASGANTLASGAIGGTGTLDVTGTLTWTGGSMTDAGTTRIAAGATLVREQLNTVFLETGRVLDNEGTIDLRTDRFISPSGAPAPLIHNQGTVVKTAGLGTATIATALENDGAVRSNAGVLELRGGDGAASSAGDYGTPAATGAVRLGAGAFELADGAGLRGGVSVEGATVDVADGATANASAANTLASGTIGGAGLMVVTGTLTWTGGSMTDAGTTRIAAGATLVRELQNTVFLETGRELENLGTIDLRTDRFISPSGAPAPLIDNHGTIVKSAGAGTATIATALENDGAVRADAGVLDLRGGDGDGTSTGDLGAPATPGSVRLGSGTFDLADRARLLGGVTIAGGTVDVPAGATASASGANAVTSGTLSGAGTLNVSGSLGWSGGTMTGTGATRVLGAGTLALAGTTTLSGGRLLEVAGLLDVQGDHTLIGGFTEPAPLVRVTTTGTLRKTAGAGTARLDPALRNDGLVDSTSGELELDRGAAQAHTGTFRGTSETALPVFSGLLDADHVLGAGADLEGWTGIENGTVGVSAGVTLAVDDQLLQRGGTLTGPGDVSVTGLVKWTGGDQEGPGATVVQPAGRIDVGADCATVGLRLGRLLDNRGTVLLRGSARLHASGDPRPVIENGGRLELDDSDPGSCPGSQGISGNALVHNTGTIDKLGGDGAATIADLVDNDGEAVVTRGELRLESTSAVTHTGAFRGPGGPVVFESGEFDVGPGAAISGNVTVDFATLRLPDGMTLTAAAGDTLRLDGGRIEGGDLRILGTFVWTDGSRGGAGTTEIEQGATANVGTGDPQDFASARLDADHVLANRGTINVLRTSWAVASGASILNAGLLEFTGGGTIEAFGGFGFGFDGLLHNTGTLRKTGTLGAIANVPLDNDGTIEVVAGELLTERLLNWSGITTHGGSLTGGTYIVRGRLKLPGAVATNAARIVVDGPGSQLIYEHDFQNPIRDAFLPFERNAAGGRLEVTGGRQLDILSAVHNAGVLRIGAGSRFIAAGGYSQGGASAVLRTELENTTSFGQLRTPETAKLGGRLDAVPAAGFQPAAGQEFAVVDAGTVAGTFDTVSGTALGGGLALEARYEAPGVKLRVVGAGGQGLEAGEPGAAPAREAAGEPLADPLGPLTLDDRALTVGAGRWTRAWQGRATLTITTQRGATLVRRGVTARKLALLVRTCRRCGAVQVHWRGQLVRRVSLRSRRRGRRLLPLATFAAPQRGTVRLRTASRGRVAIDALVVTPG